jgi:hypothetical protein
MPISVPIKQLVGPDLSSDGGSAEENTTAD